ncbi:hypothetical protein [Pseudonocardia sp. ICBG601]|uniref:hypothetical protein n=1 Tax=Pseudonocardia sp. ICBG601 TaxID=2846759 RepID=UPI001CF65145|nr:hypothetical protein [Pseudonocardia sp. ICBG601]
MRSTSNPAFRNLPTQQQGGYATFDRSGGGMMGGGAAMAGSQPSYVDPTQPRRRRVARSRSTTSSRRPRSARVSRWSPAS